MIRGGGVISPMSRATSSTYSPSPSRIPQATQSVRIPAGLFPEEESISPSSSAEEEGEESVPPRNPRTIERKEKRKKKKLRKWDHSNPSEDLHWFTPTPWHPSAQRALEGGFPLEDMERRVKQLAYHYLNRTEAIMEGWQIPDTPAPGEDTVNNRPGPPGESS